MKFRTKIVEIEAVKFTAEDVLAVNEFATEPDGTRRFNYGFDKDDGKYNIWGEIYDILHETWITVFEGQWIVRGAKGEFYPCDDETFHWKYEQVDA